MPQAGGGLESSMKKIVIIDDDEYIGDMLQALLIREGHQVMRAYSIEEAVSLFKHESVNLILINWMLPGIVKDEFVIHLRHIPTIVISEKIDEKDKVQLMQDGAVDYIIKPFDMNELLSKIRVQLSKQDAFVSNQLQVGELILNCLIHEVQIKDRSIHLTKTESALLKLLMMNPDQVISKSAMLDKIELDTPDCVESSLKVHISNLRKKLKKISDEEYIQSVWGIGFRLKIIC